MKDTFFVMELPFRSSFFSVTSNRWLTWKLHEAYVFLLPK